MEKIKELRKEEEQKAISQNILEMDNSFHKKNYDEKSTIIIKEENEEEKGIKKIKFLSRNQRKEIGKENNLKKRKRNKSQLDKGKGKED